MTSDSTLRFVALGGLGEIGMNCLAIEHQDQIVLIDCGVTFPHRPLGIDVIHPDFAYLRERADKVRAVLVTHGHEDHIGALPYLLQDMDVPIHGPEYALGLVRERLAEHSLPRDPRLHATTPRERFRVGPIEVEPVSVTHSIPDATALVLRTEVGTIVHTGDFKIDPEPPFGSRFDYARLSEVGEEGVRLLLSDSTNVDNSGTSGSETPVRDALTRHVLQARRRIVVCMFASNVHRVRGVLAAARQAGRKALLLGRSVLTHSRVAESLDMLPDDLPPLVKPEHAQAVPREQLVVIASGSQGESRAALARLAWGTHPHLRLEAEDEVLLSSRVIPGNERLVYAITNELERKGVIVRHRGLEDTLHVSGHACRDEQRMMLQLVRPQSFVPVHGTYHHLARHEELAREMGVQETLIAENGSLFELREDGLHSVGVTPVGRVHIRAGRPVPPAALRERARISELGAATVALVVDDRGRLQAAPQVSLRGVSDPDADSELVAGLVAEVERAVESAVRHRDAGPDELRKTAAQSARRYCQRQLGYRPVTDCIVTWVAS